MGLIHHQINRINKNPDLAKSITHSPEIREQRTKEARILIEHLSIHFDVICPLVVKGRGLRSCCYPSRHYSGKRIKKYPKEGRINIGKWGSLLFIVSHEFAHHLAHERKGRALRESHGGFFCKMLLEVIEVIYDHPSHYPWENEYSGVKKWAKRNGYCK